MSNIEQNAHNGLDSRNKNDSGENEDCEKVTGFINMTVTGYSPCKDIH